MVIHPVLPEAYTSVAGLDSVYLFIYLFNRSLCTPTVLCKLCGVDTYNILSKSVHM